MIGSLVVVFPTDHAGGELTLEHAGTTRRLRRDVTHAVEPVRTGYRVTLTYNLFLANRGTGTVQPQRAAPSPEQAFESALGTLLGDAAFLPAGGFLGYGLAHQYPMPRAGEGRGLLGGVLRILKGGDARILGQGSNYAGEDVISDEVLDTEHVYDEGEGELMDAIRRKEDKDYDMDSEEEPSASNALPVYWVTRITKINRVGSSYVAYGNEPSIAHAYGNAALFVRVPPFGEEVRAPVQQERISPAQKGRAGKSKKAKEEVVDVHSAPRRSTRSTRTKT
ncbi:hypothetical protein C8R47DRAFT_1326981 [Mycena vitilis]|nr:hypothetical protein C8R47DRAFT_1326981 [Mycena vitilis]